MSHKLVLAAHNALLPNGTLTDSVSSLIGCKIPRAAHMVSDRTALLFTCTRSPSICHPPSTRKHISSRASPSRSPALRPTRATSTTRSRSAAFSPTQERSSCQTRLTTWQPCTARRSMETLCNIQPQKWVRRHCSYLLEKWTTFHLETRSIVTDHGATTEQTCSLL